MSQIAGLFDAEKLRDKVEDLGCLVWYTVREAAPTRDQLARALQHAGLDASAWLPKEIFPRDAFRRATSEIEQHRVPIDGEDGRFSNLLIREVSRDKDCVVRHLVSEVVDAENVRLSYTEKVRLILRLDGPAPRVEAHLLNGPLSAAEQAAASDAVERFDHALNHYDGRAVRELVHRILLTTAPIAVKSSGGVYFVSRDQRDTVEGLRRFVQDATSGNGSRVWAMPVYDDGDAKDIIEDSLVAHVEEEGRKVVDDLARALKAGTASNEDLKTWFDRVNELRRHTDGYERLLGEHVDAARTALEVAQRQVLALLDAAAENDAP